MKNFLLGVVILFTLSNCGKEKCEFNECSIKAPAREIQSLQDYLVANNITATQHCSGIFYTIQQQGTGKRPTACGAVSLYYKGTLTNGNVFDQTQPNQPVDFELGGNIISGFKIGMLQLKSGGKMTLYIPPSLGYGAAPDPNIPANSILIFDIELLDAY